MTGQDRTDPVLRRKLRPVGAGAARDDADLKVLGRAFRKGAEQATGLDLRITDGQEDVRQLADCLSDLQDDAMILLLRGPDEQSGLIALGQQVMAAIVEMSTTGRVAAEPSEPRRPTHTDAAMATAVIDAVLLQIADLAAGLSLAKRFKGYAQPTLLSEVSAAELLLEDGAFRMTDLKVALDAEGRQGTLKIILPEAMQPATETKAGIETWRKQFKARLMTATAELEAVLHRPSLPLADLRALEVGTVLPVPVAALSHVRIETMAGAVVARGRLGQVSGSRALRLVSDVVSQPVFDLAEIASPPGAAPELQMPAEMKELNAVEDGAE